MTSAAASRRRLMRSSHCKCRASCDVAPVGTLQTLIRRTGCAILAVPVRLPIPGEVHPLQLLACFVSLRQLAQRHRLHSPRLFHQKQRSSTSTSSTSNAGMTTGSREGVAATSDAGFTQATGSKVVAADAPPKQVPVEQPATQKPTKADDRSREGSLPGFQVGFFPAYCQEPLAGWEATAEELEQIQHRSPVLQR
mmetsp:Transcript_114856/g.228581  ORF Transcript_114856/g.228581 Transcript_114856/m.228581 type:complete len:195 (+) Transcript_114856:1739-2323(+)